MLRARVFVILLLPGACSHLFCTAKLTGAPVKQYPNSHFREIFSNQRG